MRTVILINGESLGKGPDELGARLMGAFLRRLWAQDNKPGTIIFYNSGVKLLARGSSVLDALDGLFEAGVDLVACGTCVAFFELGDKIVVGRVSDMQEIAAVLLAADKVVTV